MHSRSILVFVVVVATALAAGHVQAVVIAVGDGSGNNSAPPDDPGWANVGKYGDFSAVYLRNRWVLAADHVPLATSVVFDDVTVPVVPNSEILLRNPPLSALPEHLLDELPEGVQLSEFTDLRLVRLTEDPGLPSLEISAEQPPFFEEPVEVVMIGHGRDRIAEQSFWTVTDLGANENVWEEVDGPPFSVAGYKYTDTQTKRWGTNIIFTEAVLHGGEPDGLLLFTQFSRDELVATEFEAQATTGDSGGGVFYKNDGNWGLTGVMIFRAEQVHDQPPDTAVFGSQTALVDLSYYRDQIEDLTSVKLQPGDANQDFAFDQFDIVRVLSAAKYLSGEPATWGEGDWNGAPGGVPGDPPPGDGLFNQADIVAALAAGHYLKGPLAAETITSNERNGQSDPLGPRHIDDVGLSDPLPPDGMSIPSSIGGGNALGHIEPTYIAVPEPSTVVLLLIGLAVGIVVSIYNSSEISVMAQSVRSSDGPLRASWR